MFTTTTDHIEGYRITEYLGVVFARHAGPEYGCAGMNKPDRWELRPNEADAIIGIQYVATDRYYGLIGTAVKIEKI